MDMIRVLLADDEPLIRAGLSTILQASGHITVVGEASTGQQAVTEAQRLHPDVICMDIRMPDGDGLEATRLIQQLNPTPAVIVITTFDLDEYAFEAIRAGASGFLLKDTGLEELMAAIRHVHDGDAVMAPSTTRRLIERFAARPTPAPDVESAPLDGLTSRESEVFLMLARGFPNDRIARELSIAEGTVRIHVGRILGKLGLHDRSQAVVLAYESGLIRPGER